MKERIVSDQSLLKCQWQRNKRKINTPDYFRMQFPHPVRNFFLADLCINSSFPCIILCHIYPKPMRLPQILHTSIPQEKESFYQGKENNWLQGFLMNSHTAYTFSDYSYLKGGCSKVVLVLFSQVTSKWPQVVPSEV